MTSVEFGNVVRLAAGDAVTITSCISFSPANVLAEPFVDLLLELSMGLLFGFAWRLIQFLAGLAVGLGAAFWHALR